MWSKSMLMFALVCMAVQGQQINHEEVGTNCVYFCHSGWLVTSGNELIKSLNHLLKFAKLKEVFTLKTTPPRTWFFFNTYQMHSVRLVWVVAHVSDSDTEILVYNDFSIKGTVFIINCLGPMTLCPVLVKDLIE